MDDRISTMPDSLLCHILSFLSTKECVATSVLSKTWKPLWRFVPTLDFDSSTNGVLNDISYLRFVEWVYSVIDSRDHNQPIKKFCLCLSLSRVRNEDNNVTKWVGTVVQRGVEHLDLHISPLCLFPSSVFSCRTLVVLKLARTFVKNVLSVDLPSLKILHLQSVFLTRKHFAILISRCPILVDLKFKDFLFHANSYLRKLHLSILPKFVRVQLKKLVIPFEVLIRVKHRRLIKTNGRIEFKKPSYEHLMFPNLIHLELGYYYDTTKDYLPYLIYFLHRCPKLQYLFVNKCHLKAHCVPCIADHPYPTCVPDCISFHLKTCLIDCYCGSAVELKFAKYVMENARFLGDMTLCSITEDESREVQMLKELSLCTRLSPSCKLVFDNSESSLEMF